MSPSLNNNVLRRSKAMVLVVVALCIILDVANGKETNLIRKQSDKGENTLMITRRSDEKEPQRVIPPPEPIPLIILPPESIEDNTALASKGGDNTLYPFIPPEQTIESTTPTESPSANSKGGSPESSSSTLQNQVLVLSMIAGFMFI